MRASPETLSRLKEAAGPSGWTEDHSEIAPHVVEFRGRWKGTTPLLLRPSTADQVSRILAVCDATKTPIVPQGGKTGLVGGQVPVGGEIFLSLERMNRIRAVSADENMMIAEAGVVLSNAQGASDAAGRLFPLSLGAQV